MPEEGALTLSELPDRLVSRKFPSSAYSNQTVSDFNFRKKSSLLGTYNLYGLKVLRDGSNVTLNSFIQGNIQQL